MSDLKFACPHCHQHIQCDVSYAGREISCPSCRASLRIPRATAPGPTLPEAAMLAPPQVKTQPIKTTDTRMAHAPRAPLKAQSAQEPEPSEKKGAVASRVPPAIPSVKIPAKTSPVVPPVPKTAKPSRVEPKPQAVHCVCPVCQSELRVPAEHLRTAPGQPPPKAELVRQGKPPAAPKPSSANETKPAVQKIEQATPATQANKAQAAQPGGEMKPRLSYILTGKPPPGATNLVVDSESSSSAKPKKKATNTPGEEKDTE